MKCSENKYAVAVVGGDRRQAVVASLFAERGHRVKTFGLRSDGNENLRVCDTLSDCVSKSDVIILPLPVSKDGIHLLTPDYSGKISLFDVLNLGRGRDNLPCNTDTLQRPVKYLLGGRLPKNFTEAALSLGFDVTDYYSSETLQQKNAIPTAEGAVMTAMQSLDVTLKDSRAAISGFGRIGRRLASLMLGFGAKVTVFARSDEALSVAEAMGCSLCRLGGNHEETAETLESQDILFNTVPEIVFGKEILSRLKSKPLIIELASSPGGIDAEYARDSGLGVIYAPSLPGRYSPLSAGGYIYGAILEFLRDKGVSL